MTRHINLRDRDSYTGFLHVNILRLDKGGYSYKDGRYYGVGKPVYKFYNSDGTIYDCVRSTNRREAVSFARSRYPNAKIKAEKPWSIIGS